MEHYLPKLNFPEYNFRFSKKENQIMIWDELRKKFLVCTPEEWVRQNMIQHLIHNKKYPAGRFAQEFSIKLNGLVKRCDLVLFDEFGKAEMILEFKAPHINIDQKVANQVLRYNSVLGVKKLGLSNGYVHLFFEKKEENWEQFSLFDGHFIL